MKKLKKQTNSASIVMVFLGLLTGCPATNLNQIKAFEHQLRAEISALELEMVKLRSERELEAALQRTLPGTTQEEREFYSGKNLFIQDHSEIEIHPSLLSLMKLWRIPNKAMKLFAYEPFVEKSKAMEEALKRKTGYAPIERVHEGLVYLEKYRFMSERNMILCEKNQSDSNPQKCRIMINGFFQHGLQAAILSCVVTRIHRNIGPPSDCVPLSFSKENGETWILANIVEQGNKMKQDLYLYEEPPNQDKARLGVLCEKIINFLSSPPLTMLVGMQYYTGSVTIDAIKPFRASPILRGWREWTRIRFQINQTQSSNLQMGSAETSSKNLTWEHFWKYGYVIIDMSMTIYVSKTNSEDTSEWHMPTQQQLAIYNEHVSNGLATSIGKLCNGRIMIQAIPDGARFQCHR